MFLIVDMSQSRWDRRRGGEWIAGGQEPHFVHDNRDGAEAELLRLQAHDPAGEFKLFEAVAIAQPTMSSPSVYRIEELERRQTP